MDILDFDHLEFFVSDCTSTTQYLKSALGLREIAYSSHQTGNHKYKSVVLQRDNIKFIVTAPYKSIVHSKLESTEPHPHLINRLKDFLKIHGNGVGTIGFKVDDISAAYNALKQNGVKIVTHPTALTYTNDSNDNTNGEIIICEFLLYGDVIAKLIQYKDCNLPYPPLYKEVVVDTSTNNGVNIDVNYNLHSIDHVVGNVYNMENTIQYIKSFTNMHTFAKFSKDDIQTKWTSLNSEVLANTKESVLLPINEPVLKKNKSQITEFLEANNGEGVQHIALKTKNILDTVSRMKVGVSMGMGIEFIETPAEYYQHEKIKKILDKLAERIGSDGIERIEKLGILVDEDPDGILLQIFTKPMFDEPTIFIEIIQRDCSKSDALIEVPGCGGFGKGNFQALFESIERMQQKRGVSWDD